MCGASSYRRVIARDQQGHLRAAGPYQCSGCSVVFADPKTWYDSGLPEVNNPTLPPAPLTSLTVTIVEV
jgi:hypothetical protein